MTQIWLFAAGCMIGTLGVLVSLVFVQTPADRPAAGSVAGLLIVVLGLAVTLAGAFAG